MPSTPASKNIDIFISHSAADLDLATRLVKLLATSLHVRRDRIRCTSVAGTRLPSGALTSELLRDEIREARTFIGLISPASIKSSYVSFELGARWLTGLQLTPIIVPPGGFDLLPAVLKERHALRTDERTDIQQLLDEIAKELGIFLQPANVYEDELSAVLLAKAEVLAPPPAATAPVQATDEEAAFLFGKHVCDRLSSSGAVVVNLAEEAASAQPWSRLDEKLLVAELSRLDRRGDLEIRDGRGRIFSVVKRGISGSRVTR